MANSERPTLQAPETDSAIHVKTVADGVIRGREIASSKDLDATPPNHRADTTSSQHDESLTPIARYYDANELDVRAKVIEDIDASAPQLSGFSQGGRLVAALWIEVSGMVVDIKTEGSTVPAEFVRLAKARFYRARFSPGMKDGEAVNSILRIEMIFARGRKS